ncbi:DNA topoisomerase [Dunaliella salina]|uniref:DNA topoisomerase n=1 Tax=Dunaliella salina TaxID=3046 RepID=A0ABQ7G6L9_DUNSA|nr:DNA topoisomerase [Dunaliella salina]|eukprot:KAF5830244.1 DNA topoisomerase [Dunaliella salina]
MLGRSARFASHLRSQKGCGRLGSRHLSPYPWAIRRCIFVTPSAGGQSVMIVESPTKAVKIQKFLGDQYKVLSSYGHIRDLPAKAGSVLPEEDFRMLWGFQPRTYQRYKEIEQAVRQANRVGAAMQRGTRVEQHAVWQANRGHGLLKGRAVQRVTFTEITQLAVERALQAPREVSTQLVDAYLARRALDYLVGFNISPLLWRKLQGATSAGRVQSVALRLCCEREVEASKFVPEEYWSISAQFGLPGNKTVSAMLSRADGKKMGGMAIRGQEQAHSLTARIKAASFQVSDTQSKLQQRQPAAPFITSTLQQEASKRLGFGASRTMQAAQALYEGSEAGEGLITYMRTDGVQLSPEAVNAVRSTVVSHFGPNLVSQEPRVYKSRAKNAQEAHEAIRPTNPRLTPDKLPANLSSDQSKLYRLIWERTLASQMRNAVIEQVGVDFSNNDGSLILRATGSSVKEPGYLQAYDNFRRVEGEPEEQSSSDGPDNGATEANNSPSAAAVLSTLKKQQAVNTQEVQPAQHFTRPPPRYTEASLIKALEEQGIGRPSTYASTLKVLQTRGYITKEGRALVPSSKGLVLVAFLQRYFQQYIDYDFTSTMEQQLDEVSEGSVPWKSVLKDFWGPFQEKCESLKDLKVSEVVDALNEELLPVFFPGGDEEARRCPKCLTGTLHYKPSKFGGFVGCSNFDHPQEPCSYARPLQLPNSAESSEAMDEALVSGPLHLGYHPTTGQAVLRKKGPYGPYLELGPVEGTGGPENGAGAKQERGKKGAAKKEKKADVVRASIPKDIDPSSVTLEHAIALLDATVPQSLGSHPDDGAPILIKSGRYGPYVQHQAVLAPLPKDKAPENITLEEALELISKKAARMAAKGIPTVPKEKVSKKASKEEAGTGKASSSKGVKVGRGEASNGGAADKSSKKTTGYLLFCNEQRPAIAAANPEARPAEMMKLLAAAWQAQGEDGKAAYNALAAAEGSSEKASTAEARPASGKAKVSTANSKGSAGARGQPAQAVSPGREGRTVQSSSRRANSTGSMPEASGKQRNANPYIEFCGVMRPKVKADNPGASPSQVMQLLAAAWREHRAAGGSQ